MPFLEDTTIAPWILGTLTLLLLFALFVSFKSWRDMKRSPYFFMRRQAERRLQTYSIASTCLILVTVMVGGYVVRPSSADDVLRVAPLTNSKPPTEEIRSLVESSPTTTIELLTEEGVSLDELAASNVGETSIALSPAELLQQIRTLPDQFNQYSPTVELLENTEITPLVFSTKINDDYQATNPESIFAEGSYTIYATFDYRSMQDGMVWSWVWRKDGEVVSGGNEVWNYGDEGPGFVFYNPEEGFSNGDYTLEIWVNGEMFTQSDMLINTAAATANN